MGIFATSIQLSTTKILAKVNEQVYRIAWELFTNVVKFTPSPSNPGPHAKGLLANQWYPKAGSASSEKSIATSGTGAGSLSRINAMMGGKEFLGKDGKLTLTNNMDYAQRAESEGWPRPKWSGKIGPYMMAARSLQATVAKYRKVTI